MPVAEALRSQLAWSSKKASKSPNTASSHSGGVLTRRSSIAGPLYLPGGIRLVLAGAGAPARQDMSLGRKDHDRQEQGPPTRPRPARPAPVAVKLGRIA